MSTRVLLVRRAKGDDPDAVALRDRGVEVFEDPYLSIRTCDDDGASARAGELLDALGVAHAWLVVTSANGVRALVDLIGVDALSRRLCHAQRAGTCFAAVGPTSAAALGALGIDDVVVPERMHTASALLDRLDRLDLPQSAAVLPQSDIADQLLPSALRERGWLVTARTLYRTLAVIERPVTADELAAGEFDAIVLRSPSAVHAVRAHVPQLATPVVAGGPTTALAAARAGFNVAAVADGSRSMDVAAAVGIALNRTLQAVTHD